MKVVCWLIPIKGLIWDFFFFETKSQFRATILLQFTAWSSPHMFIFVLDAVMKIYVKQSFCHISFVRSCQTWTNFSSTQVLKRKFFVYLHKNHLIYLALATLIHGQESWYLRKVPVPDTSQIQLPAFPHSESSNAISRERHWEWETCMREGRKEREREPSITAVMQKPHDTFRSWIIVLSLPVLVICF